MMKLLAFGLVFMRLHSSSAESLFDDDEIAAMAESGEESAGGDIDVGDGTEPSPDEVTFSSDAEEQFKLGTDLTFDEQGNVQEGGNRFDPDISFWHVVEFNGERLPEPTDGSAKLIEAIASGAEYVVKFAPPNLGMFKCTEKVRMLNLMFEQDGWTHEFPEEIIERALAALKYEGVVNTKQLGELDEKDYDEIRFPAIIKSRLRKVRAEAREQSAVAGNPVTMDSQAVADEVAEFMKARVAGQEDAKKEVVQENTTDPEETEEDGTFKSLVWAVMNCPTCKGKETIACFRTCRYGGALEEESGGKTWSECLDKCVTNRFLRATIWAMLPREA